MDLGFNSSKKQGITINISAINAHIKIRHWLAHAKAKNQASAKQLELMRNIDEFNLYIKNLPK